MSERDDLPRTDRRGGFEDFYGFIGGENNQWDPALYEGTTPIEPPRTPAEGYHLTEDLTDKAIAWTRQQKALMGDWVQIDLGKDARDADHFISPEERIRVTMARQ